MQIREMERTDLIDCALIFLRVYNGPDFGEFWDEQSSGMRLKEIFDTPGLVALVAEDDTKGQVAGFVMGTAETWFSGRQLRLKECCVAPDRRREGIGRGLMNGLMEHLIMHDVDLVRVQTARGSLGESFLQGCGFLPNPPVAEMVLKAS